MDDFGVQTKIREHILFTGFIVRIVCVRYLARSSGAVSLRDRLKNENKCFINGDDKVNLPTRKRLTLKTSPLDP